MKHEAKDKTISYNEFTFLNHNSIHIMGSNKKKILKDIISERKKILTSQGTNKNFWRSPLSTIQNNIRKKTYPDIGGKMQLGICYPRGFKLTPIYDPNLLAKYFEGKHSPHLIYQGIDLFSDPSLRKVGDCSIEIDSVSTK
jgi:hypothetical protein